MFKALNNKKIIIVLSAFLSFYSLLQCFTVHIGGGLDKVVLFAGLILLEIKYTDIVSEYNKSEKTLIKIITVIYAVFWTIGKFALYNSEYAEADYRLIKLSVIFIGALFLFNMCVSYI